MQKLDLKQHVQAAGMDGRNYQFVEEAGRDKEGQPIRRAHDASLGEMIGWLVKQIPLQTLTMADAEHGTRVLSALDGDGSLEDADASWLMQKIVEFGPNIYGITAYNLKLAFEGAPRRVAGVPAAQGVRDGGGAGGGYTGGVAQGAVRRRNAGEAALSL